MPVTLNKIEMCHVVKVKWPPVSDGRQPFGVGLNGQQLSTTDQIDNQ